MKRLAKVRGSALFALALLIAGAASYGVASLAFSGTSQTKAQTGPQTSGPPPQDVQDKFREDRDREMAADRAKSRFTGKVGRFEVVGDDPKASPGSQCASVDARLSTRDNTKFRSTELEVPGMWEQTICDDGIVVAAYGQLGRRSYFRGDPLVADQVPQDRLELMDLDGRPALAVKPPTKVGPVYLYVIEREPTAERPGILVLAFGGNGLDDAIAAARTLMAK